MPLPLRAWSQSYDDPGRPGTSVCVPTAGWYPVPAITSFYGPIGRCVHPDIAADRRQIYSVELRVFINSRRTFPQRVHFVHKVIFQMHQFCPQSQSQIICRINLFASPLTHNNCSFLSIAVHKTHAIFIT